MKLKCFVFPLILTLKFLIGYILRTEQKASWRRSSSRKIRASLFKFSPAAAQKDSSTEREEREKFAAIFLHAKNRHQDKYWQLRSPKEPTQRNLEGEEAKKLVDMGKVMT